MKYIRYTEEDFIKDEYFQKWILNPDPMVNNFWENWIATHPEKKEVAENAARFIRLIELENKAFTHNEFSDLYQNIAKRSSDYKTTRIFSRSPFFDKRNPILKAAAVFAGVAVTGFGIYLSGVFHTAKDTVAGTIPRVTLELHDGTIKALDETVSQIITDTKGQPVVSHKQKTLLYNVKKATAQETVVFNQLTVPYGTKFGLVLSDGSRVFLNSGSTLRYPVDFLKDKPRDVFLDGEAYFSVKIDKKRPFTVITDKIGTRVYGTEFNVSDYKNENNTSTVLVEGSVGVYTLNADEAKKPVMITPGQRAVVENGTIAVNQVNVKKYIAWKEGKLLFLNDRFELILKELERHFNVTIINRFKRLNDKRFTGTFTEESLGQILKVCQEHSPFDYNVSGDTIIIAEKNEHEH